MPRKKERKKVHMPRIALLEPRQEEESEGDRSPRDVYVPILMEFPTFALISL